MSDRGTCWSITINNPIPADDDNIALAKQRGWKVEGQLEQGEQGTPHYQLCVKTPQVRFSAVKKAFPRSHIELARNTKALEAYVSKEDTRVAALPTNDRYPSMAKLWSMFYTWFYEHNYIKQHDSWDPEKWLTIFDSFIEDKMYEGYVVETMAVNPQVRSIIKKFGRCIIIRESNLLHDESVRQTQEITLPTYDIPDAQETTSEAGETQEDDDGASGCSEDTSDSF